MPAVSTTTKVALPPGLRSGHVEHLVTLPAPYTMRCLLGQLVDVRDPVGNRYLLGGTDTHWTLHRRVTPDARGHARNATEVGPPVGFAKDGE